MIMCSLLAVVVLSVLWICQNQLVLEIGSPEVRVQVKEGDEFFRTYRHSMYEVPVSEKFRIENGYFRLVHVITQSDAVLAYLGLERKDEPNVDRMFTEFTIPAASVGNHVIRLHDREIPLEALHDQDGRIRVRLLRTRPQMSIANIVGR